MVCDYLNRKVSRDKVELQNDEIHICSRLSNQIKVEVVGFIGQPYEQNEGHNWLDLIPILYGARRFNHLKEYETKNRDFSEQELKDADPISWNYYVFKPNKNKSILTLRSGGDISDLFSNNTELIYFTFPTHIQIINEDNASQENTSRENSKLFEPYKINL